jgi:hypothetical protein
MQIAVRVLRGADEPYLLVPAQPLSGVMDLYVIADYEVAPGVKLEFEPGQIVIALEGEDGQGNPVLMAHRYTAGAIF